MILPNDPFADPRVHVANIQGMLGELIGHLRDDIAKVPDPKAKVLFETAAEVLTGLRIAFDHYGQGTEPAFREEAA